MFGISVYVVMEYKKNINKKAKNPKMRSFFLVFVQGQPFFCRAL